jgi:hypothetical protein
MWLKYSFFSSAQLDGVCNCGDKNCDRERLEVLIVNEKMVLKQ